MGSIILVAACGSSGHPVRASSPAVASCVGTSAVRDEPAFVIDVGADGHVCWETPLTQPQAGSHTSSTPIIDNGTAYLDSDTVVFAVDLATGRQRWRWDSGSMQGTAGYGGGNSTLAVADDRVLATKGNNVQQSVVGLQQGSGAVEWTRPEPYGHNGPVPTEDGGLAFAGDTGAVIEVIDDSSGRTRWSRPAPAPTTVAGGLVEVFAGPTPAGANLIEGGQSADVQAVRASDGTVAWTVPGQFNTIAAVGPVLLLTPEPDQNGHYDVNTSAVDPATGRVLWSLGPFDPGGSTFSDVGGALLHAEVGQQPSYERLDPVTGNVLWKTSTQVYAVTAVDGELVDLETTGYQTGAESIVARDPATGAVRWRTSAAPTNGESDNPFRVQLFALAGSTGATLAEVHRSTINGFDPATGAARWAVELPAQTVIDGDATVGTGLVLQASDLQYAIPSR